MRTNSVRPGIPATVLGTCCIPWQAPGEMDLGRFRSTIRYLHGQGLRDLYIFGTAGEGHAVSEGQFRRVSEVFVNEMLALGADPMVGIIGLPLATTLERLNFVVQLGVTQAQVSLPSWGALKDVEVDTFFLEVCDGFPSMRFLHYNLSRAGRLLMPDDYLRLTKAHPNLVATKYGLGDPETVAGLMSKVPHMTHFFTELGFYLAAPLGPCGLLSSISSSNPRRAWQYFEAGRNGDTRALAELYVELARVMIGIRDSVGRGWTDGAYDKVISKIADPDFPLLLAPPYRGDDLNAYRAYRALLEVNFPGWLPNAV